MSECEDALLRVFIAISHIAACKLHEIIQLSLDYLEKIEAIWTPWKTRHQ